MKNLGSCFEVVLKHILPVGYWENEFGIGWKNGRNPDKHFLYFLERYRNEIGPEILDVGSGDGRHLLIMARLGYCMTGLEITESGLSATQIKLRENNLSAQLIRGDFHDLPFEDGRFDSVVSTQALHYNNWPGVQKSFSEIARVLKSGGLFFFRARSEKGHWRDTDCQIEDVRGITRIETRGPEKFVVVVHDYTLEELEYLAKEYNFAIIDTPIDEDVDNKPGEWNVVFQKL